MALSRHLAYYGLPKGTISPTSIGPRRSFGTHKLNQRIGASYGGMVLAESGLVGYWRLHGGGEDSKGSNHGTPAGGVLFQQAGALAGDPDLAASFDRVSAQQVSIPHAAALAITGDMTIELWIKRTGSGNYDFLVTKESVSGWAAPYTLMLHPTDQPRLTVGNGSSETNIIGTTAPALGVWQHLAVTISGSTVTHYLNGLPNGSGSIAAQPRADGGTALSLGGPRLFHLGGMDEPAIYNVALTAAQVLQHYNAGIGGGRGIPSFGPRRAMGTQDLDFRLPSLGNIGPRRAMGSHTLVPGVVNVTTPSIGPRRVMGSLAVSRSINMAGYRSRTLGMGGLMAYWGIEGAVNPEPDLSGNGWNGTYAGGVATQQVALLSGEPWSRSADFDGVNDSLGALTFSPFVQGSKRTFFGWARRDSNAADGSLFGSTATSNVVNLRAPAGSSNVVFYPNTGVGGLATWTGVLPADGTPFSWALAYDDATGIGELFINGVSQGTRTHATSRYQAAAGNFRAGAYITSTRPWNGPLGHYAVYDRLLTAGEIAALAGSGAGGSIGPRRAFGSHTATPGPIFRAVPSIGPRRAFGTATFGMYTLLPSAGPRRAFGTWRVTKQDLAEARRVTRVTLGWEHEHWPLRRFRRRSPTVSGSFVHSPFSRSFYFDEEVREEEIQTADGHVADALAHVDVFDEIAPVT